jgi:hypothetical protein
MTVVIIPIPPRDPNDPGFDINDPVVRMLLWLLAASPLIGTALGWVLS